MGLANLDESGSGQFSESQFKKMIHALPAYQAIIDVDLREESHGFLNGNAISWRAVDNWGNVGKTQDQIKADEVSLLVGLKGLKQVKILKFYDHYKNCTPHNFEIVPVKRIFTEKEMTDALHIEYRRIYVSDRRRPTDQQVDELIRFFKTLPPHTWLHFHCLAGKGRTTTLMVMYDMLHNAKQVSFDTILDRQAALGGANLKKLPHHNQKFYRYSSERLAFLKEFYVYCRSNNGDFVKSWSDWVTERSLSHTKT